jgi:Ca2+/Na+ antiporter
MAFGMLLASLIALAYVFNGITTTNWSMTGIAVFALFILFIFFLLNLRGEQILYVHDEHLEVLYERLNIATPEIHVNTPRADITEIKYYTRWVESTDSDGDSSSYKVHVTGIVLKNPDDERSLTQSKYAIPLVEIQSGTQTEAENMADSLNYLLQIKDKSEEESEPKETFWAEVHGDADSTIAQQKVSSSESSVSIGTPMPISEKDTQSSSQNESDGFIPHEPREVGSSVIAQTCIAIFVGGLVFITIGFGSYDRDIYWGLDVIITANSFTWGAIMASLGILYTFAVYAAYSKRTYIAHLGLENTVVVRTSWFNKPQKEKMRIDLTPTSFVAEYNYHSYDEESGQSNTSTNYEIRTPGQQSLKIPDGFSSQKVLEVTGLTLQVSEDSYSADFD